MQGIRFLGLPALSIGGLAAAASRATAGEVDWPALGLPGIQCNGRLVCGSVNSNEERPAGVVGPGDVIFCPKWSSSVQ